MSKRSAGLLTLAVLAVVALLVPPVEARPNRPHRPPQVDVEGVVEHLEAFQDIADENGGTRASGTPGYEASVDYVVDRLRDAGYRPQVQEFMFPFFQQVSPTTFEEVSPTARTFAEETDYFLGEFSGAGDVEAPLQGVDNVLPPPPEPGSTAGCEDGDFAGFTPGNIALIQRGTCTFEEKVLNAVEAQAAGVVLFNEGQPGRTEAFIPALGQPFDIPVVMASFDVGSSLAAEAALGEVVVHLVTDTFSEERPTWNVIADTRTGSPNHTVVVGAHLDSVQAGPGINDNGSGSASILEVAEELAERRGGGHGRGQGHGAGLRNRIRFAWWGAEESGLLGAEHYVSSLSERELSRIALNLNFDMVGSTNYVRFVYDGDGSDTDTAGPAGSDAIEAQLIRHFERQGLETEPTAFDGRSDYGPFIDVGIPAGGLFTGAEGLKTPEQVAVYGGTAGEQYDPCYHEACDTIDNVDETVLDQMADAIAHATWYWGNHRLPRRTSEASPEAATTAASLSATHHGHAVIA